MRIERRQRVRRTVARRAGVSVSEQRCQAQTSDRKPGVREELAPRRMDSLCCFEQLILHDLLSRDKFVEVQ